MAYQTSCDFEITIKGHAAYGLSPGDDTAIYDYQIWEDVLHEPWKFEKAIKIFNEKVEED